MGFFLVSLWFFFFGFYSFLFSFFPFFLFEELILIYSYSFPVSFDLYL